MHLSGITKKKVAIVRACRCYDETDVLGIVSRRCTGAMLCIRGLFFFRKFAISTGRIKIVNKIDLSIYDTPRKIIDLLSICHFEHR